MVVGACHRSTVAYRMAATAWDMITSMDKKPRKKTMQELAAERPGNAGLRMLAEAESQWERNRGFGVYDHMIWAPAKPAPAKKP